MRKAVSLLLAMLALAGSATAQEYSFNRGDTLRGKLLPERTCFDVRWYDLEIKVDPAAQTISGRNVIRFTATTDFDKMQLDLFKEMHVDRIEMEGKECTYGREYNAVFVDLPRQVRANETAEITVFYGGAPHVAVRAPWDGGFVWSRDKAGKPWVGVACEGTGASLWWPCKDHLSDEPDSMRIATIVPDGLMSVSNGNLREKRLHSPGWTLWDWRVTYPINSYNVTVNIADYVQLHDTYTNASGTHDLDYYVLSANKALAEKQFQQVKPMMECYEQHFGEYPFWRDGYALVETPYLGMEHQGAIAYGNKYKKGYDGLDLMGLGFDYIIIHETGHEWWGNSVSTDDHAELWIHESFCTYAEAVYVECRWDEATAENYMMGHRMNIANIDPIVGPRDVNFEDHASSDMYYKGAWMLHSLRHMLDTDEQWFGALHDFATEFRMKVTNTNEVINWWSAKTGRDLGPFFRQFLYHKNPPRLEYKVKGKGKKVKFSYRWVADEEGFDMPIRVLLDDERSERLYPTAEWQKATLVVEPGKFAVDNRHFYHLSKSLD
jgi:aminopeptidase N